MPVPAMKIVSFAPPPPLALSDWTVVGASNYLRVLDALEDGKIVDPDAVAASEDRQVFSRDSLSATFVGLRMRYDEFGADGAVIKLFGRVRLPDGTAGSWCVLPNRLRDRSVPLTTDPSDVIIDATYQTTADPEAQYFDMQGCNEFVVGVEVIADNCSEAYLDVKFI